MYTEGDVVSFIESEGRWSGRIQIGVVMAHENGFRYVVKFGDLLSREKHRVDDIHRKIADISDPIDLIIKKWNNYFD